jgi:MSHA biogenesis protein MshM
MSAKTVYITAGPYQDIISGTQLILSFSDGVVKLTGPQGAGKTRLLQELQKVMEDEGQRTLLFSPPPKSVLDLHNTLTRTFTLGADLSFRKSLTRYLCEQPRDEQSLVLLIDDADSMDDETLADLVLFRSVSNNDQGLISVVLFGLPELEARLDDPAFADLTKDIVLNYELDALTRQQLAAFCKAAIAELRLDMPMPSARALDRLLEETGGLPGVVLEHLPQFAQEPEAEPEAEAEQDMGLVSSHARDEVEYEEEANESVVPFDRNKLRKALYGGVALAASAAAVFLLYPVLRTMLDGSPAPATVVSIPAPVPAPAPAPAPISSPPVMEEAPVEVAVSGAEAVDEPALEISELPLAQIEEEAPELLVASETAPIVEPEPLPTAEPELIADVTETEAPEVEAPEATAQVATLAPEPEPIAVVAPVRAPVSLVPVFPAATAQDDSPQALEAMVVNWLNAWQSQNLDGYFAAYHTDFAPLYQNTRAAWRDNRVRSISRPNAINIAVEDFTVSGRTAIGAHVTFWMEYQTNSYADRTFKELVIGHDIDGSLRILQEINRQVVALTPSEVISGTGVASIASSATPAVTSPAAITPATVATATTIGQPVQLGSVYAFAAAPRGSAGIADTQVVEINTFLGSWLHAWQNKDIDGYLRHYHPDFRSTAHATQTDWREDRIRKISRPLAIQINLLSLQVQTVSNGESQLEMQMEYHSTYYSDRTVKEIRLVRGANGGWLIVAERNQRVDTLPLSRLVPAGTTLTIRGGLDTIYEHAL